jgi:ABC-2 type transport system permease protein
MNAQSNVMNESVDSQRMAGESMIPTQPLYWSIRRELWEHSSIYVAPLVVAGVALVGFSLGSILGIWEKALALNAAQPQGPYDMAAGLMMLTGIVVSVFYCVDALHGERRDRSILFWKSMPVSDVTTVLAKASIPLVILPAFIVAITVALYFLMLVVSSVALMASGESVSSLWAKVPLFRMSWLMLYHVVTAHALWPAPFYCWLLLVSAWSRRSPFIWAVLPLVAIAGFEQVTFRTWHFASLIGSRLLGLTPTHVSTSTNTFPTNPMAHISPYHFFSSPGLWVGLAFAAVFLAGAVRLRRYREPI